MVNVEQVDEHTGMIMYNCGGQGLLMGVRGKVYKLVRLMVDVRSLQALSYNLV